MRTTHWNQLTTTEFADLDPEKTIAVLPVAAMEQHGPHLAVSTDTIIAEGMIAETLKQLPDDLSILILPTQAVGKSNEHLRSPGTLTLTAETAIRAWTEIGESVHRAGLRKLVMVNSHGGNVDVLSIVARELRVRLNMLAVTCSWSRFGRPPGLYDDQEVAVGIHAGDIETSLMLHFRPDLVRMDKAEDFRSQQLDLLEEFKRLRFHMAPARIGWQAQDLNPSGAVGNAARATAERGRPTCEYQAGEFIRLLRDVRDFSLTRLA